MVEDVLEVEIMMKKMCLGSGSDEGDVDGGGREFVEGSCYVAAAGGN